MCHKEIGKWLSGSNNRILVVMIIGRSAPGPENENVFAATIEYA